MTPRTFTGLALGGTVALAGWGAVGLGGFNASHTENTTVSIAERGPTPPEPAVVTTTNPASETTDASSPPESALSSRTESALSSQPESVLSSPSESVFAPAGSPAAEVPAAESVLAPAGSPAAELPAAEPVSSDAGSKPEAETGMQLASVPPSVAVEDDARLPVRAIEPPGQCFTDTCIDAYLWSLYERTPKVDTVKETQKIKSTVKKKGKTRTVTQTVTTYVVDDFTWKDPAAAKRGGMSLMDYVIGGMDPAFKLKLYRALRAMDEAGLMPGITSGFRDDYRQSIAAGNKAAPDSSFHGGSRRGGYRHGLAADIVSVRGDNRMQRYASSEELWKWVDAHEKEYGIGRPYLDHDPPHVGPIDGIEYTVKRALANARRALQAKTEKSRSKAAKQPAARIESRATKHATPPTLSKVTGVGSRAPLAR